MKKCSVCKKLRKSSSFHKSSRNNDGLDYWCKFCKKIRNKIYNSTHKEKIAKRTKKYYLLHKEETLKQCKKYASEHKKEIKQRQHKWYKRNKKSHNNYTKAYYLKHKDKLLKDGFRQALKRNFNLSINDYNTMMQEQKGVCAICKRTETLKKTNRTSVRRLSVDHDHKTGKVRGLLCNRCNVILGKIEDNTILLNTMIKYLQNNKGE
jgi:hypothetical protein